MYIYYRVILYAVISRPWNKRKRNSSVLSLQSTLKRTEFLGDWLTCCHWPTDRPTDRLADWLTDRQTDGRTDGRTDWLTARLPDWLMDGWIDWLIDWCHDTWHPYKRLWCFIIIYENFKSPGGGPVAQVPPVYPEGQLQVKVPDV